MRPAPWMIGASPVSILPVASPWIRAFPSTPALCGIWGGGTAAGLLLTVIDMGCSPFVALFTRGLRGGYATDALFFASASASSFFSSANGSSPRAALRAAAFSKNGAVFASFFVQNISIARTALAAFTLSPFA